MRSNIQAVDNFVRSKPHRQVEKHLQKIGLSYLSEKDFPPYIVDIYLPEWHIGIEIDGPFHSKNKDKVRDKYLMIHYGLPVIRFGLPEITFKNLEPKITAFIEEHEPTAWDRKELWLQTRR